jgi:chromosome segregation ATPase
VKQKKKIIKKINKETEKNLERKRILEEHLKNVEQELLHTKSLIDNKNKETETENHLWQVTERQCGRLENEIKKYNKVMLEYDERLNDIQVRIFRTNEKV